MTRKEIIYSVFYILVFAFAIWAGRVNGFTDSLTPSIPFAIEFFTLIIGAVLLAIEFGRHETATFKKVRVHLLGLTANSMLMLYVLLLAL
jgi:hypothetical protein